MIGSAVATRLTLLAPGTVVVAGTRGVEMSLLTSRRKGPWMHQGDAVTTLLEGARRGDQESWNRLVERYLPLVSSVIARHRLFGADAEDVNQTVWLRLVEHLADIREPQALPGWIATTTRHECLHTLTRGKRSVAVDPQTSPQLQDVTDEREVAADLLTSERHLALLEALEGLPDDRRALLLLLLEDPPPSYGEISARLGLPVGSIGPTRARALEQLRKSPALRAHIEEPFAAERGDSDASARR